MGIDNLTNKDQLELTNKAAKIMDETVARLQDLATFYGVGTKSVVASSLLAILMEDWEVRINGRKI